MLLPVLVALATGVDGFIIGIGYGIRKIRIRQSVIFLINIVSVIILGISMFLGMGVYIIFPRVLIKLISATVIFLLGLLFIIQAFIDLRFPAAKNGEKSIKRFNIRLLGLIIEIIREPGKADIDNSGTIDYKEAVFLGTALSLDAMAVGFAVSMSDISIPLTLACCFLINCLFINCGLLIGSVHFENKLKEKAGFMPGIILIIISILKLM